MASTENSSKNLVWAHAASVMSQTNPDSVQTLFERGLTRQAFERGQSFGPLSTWRETSAQILASRILADLGAPKLALALQIRAYRAAPSDWQARAYFAAATLERRGPLAAWQLLREFGEPVTDGLVDTPALEHILSLRARVAAIWRDFETANLWLERAERISPNSPWLAVQRSFLLEQEDRYDDCLRAAQHSLELRPWYRQGILATAHALQLLDRDEEALALLNGSTRHLESVTICMRLAALQADLELHTEAEQTLSTLLRLAPALEKEGSAWVTRMRFLAAYRKGDVERAAELGQAVQDPSLQKLRVQLASPPVVPRNFRLAVDFVRQHRVTCSPATLTALTRFWNKPAEHLAIAEEICYDGTPAHSERHWAEQNGFVAREFTVTWDATVALLERGIPFALHTVEIAGGHAQAVVGFDGLRQSLTIRDPYHYFTTEMAAEDLLQQYRATGPRGMAMVPAEQAGLLDGLTLPDTALYDQLHSLHRALASHRRDEAHRWSEQMAGAAPKHRLTLTSQLALAAYDSNTSASLEAINALLELFPDDGQLSLNKLRCLQRLGRREERLALLERLSQRPDCDPIFLQEYAVELAIDARNANETRRWLRRAVRRRPGDVTNLALLAEECWHEQQFEQALELHRYTACVAELQEGPALNYFSAARWRQQTDEALQFLRQRVRRWGAKSFWPAATLFRAYAQLDELPQAFAMLEAELQRRPDDGEFLLFAADVHSRFGRMDDASRCLERAGRNASRDLVLRVAAQLAELRGETSQALSDLTDVATRDPLALDVQQSIARLHAVIEGRTAALDHLEGVCHRFPHHFGLHQLWVSWIHDEGAKATERVVRRLVGLHPDNVWARRELALALSAQGRLSEALVEARQSLNLDPRDPQSHATRALLLAQNGDDSAAREGFCQALKLSIDLAPAMQGLLNSCQTPRERSDAIAFIASELQQQPSFGDALLVFREIARLNWPAEQLIEFLREQLRERPMQWQPRVALVHQLAESDQLDESLRIALEATNRFPLSPNPWSTLAFVQRIRCDRDGELKALHQLLRLQPHDGDASSQLAEFHARAGEFKEAQALVERAASRDRLDPRHPAHLATFLWRSDDRNAAIEKVIAALRLHADSEWLWQTLFAWTVEVGRPQLATEQARALIKKRNGEARPWLRLAIALANENLPAEALQALDEALKRNPRSVDAHDIKAIFLCQLNRHDDALDVCRAAVWNGRPPVELRFRAIWIQAHRGHLPRATTELRQLLESHPGNFAGWRDLADWNWRRADEAGALAAVKQMLRLSPLDPQPYCFRAEIRSKQRDRDGARSDFQRALQLDPTCAHAATGLFEMQLADHASEEAEATLRIIQRQIGGKLARECTARLESLRAKDDRDQLMIERARRTSRGGADFEQAAAHFQELCLNPSAEPAVLEVAFWKLENMADGSESQRILKNALDNPQANPEVGALWVRSKIARKQWGLSTRLDELLRTNAPIGRRAVMAYARALGTSQRKKGLRYLLKDHSSWLKEEPLGWASVGLALSAAGETRRFLQWMANWRNHPGAGQDVFAPFVLALRNKGQDRQANEAARIALSLPRQSDEAFYQLSLWCAAEDALQGKTREAREVLDQVSAETISGPFRRIHRLIRSVIEVQGAPRADLTAARKAALRRVKHNFADLQFLRAGRSTRRLFRRSLRRISIDGRSIVPLLWGYWRLYGSGVYAVIAFPLVVGLLSLVPWLLPLFAGAFFAAKRRRGQIIDS